MPRVARRRAGNRLPLRPARRRMPQELREAHDLHGGIQALERAVEVVRMTGRLDGLEVRLEVGDLRLEQPRVEGRREPVVFRSRLAGAVQEARRAEAPATRPTL